eukprot:TRINITY_DN848_c0_g1_i1.p1 TRINITY_DN848_c0_g1~~TRINITY_DN848_c0_g1_i1.p1  ORF type:complete len:480 (-),score=105.04 TRINITY_DN848_c0_g1_i1:1003-2259(-)
MDGFKLLELIGLELDLPVIMMSAHGETSVVMKGITHGACDYLLKPVRIEELRNIWQHVIRKKKIVIKDEHSGEWDGDGDAFDSGDRDLTSKKRKEKSDDDEQLTPILIEDMNSLKKARVVWSVELHQQFVNAVNQLGIDKAVPKKIMDIMNVQGLTRENVASHLQKYRLYLKRLSGVQPVPHPVATFRQAPPDAPYGGTMQINPGGRGAVAAAGHRSISAGGMGVGQPELDNATLVTLAQLQALRVRQQQQSASQDQQEAVGGNSLSSVGSGGFSLPMANQQNTQGLSSWDLELLIQQVQQEANMRQRLALETGTEGALSALQIVGLDSTEAGLGNGNIVGLGNLGGNGSLSGLGRDLSASLLGNRAGVMGDGMPAFNTGSFSGNAEPIGGDLLNQLMSQAASTRARRQAAAQAFNSG